MDFGTTMRFLVEMQDRFPGMQWKFDDVQGELVLRLGVGNDVPNLFHQGAKMFAPID